MFGSDAAARSALVTAVLGPFVEALCRGHTCAGGLGVGAGEASQLDCRVRLWVCRAGHVRGAAELPVVVRRTGPNWPSDQEWAVDVEGLL